MIKFKKKIPNEYLTEDFSQNKMLELEYNGPNILYVIVDCSNDTVGHIVSFSINVIEKEYIKDIQNKLIIVDAQQNPDVAYMIYTLFDPLPERICEDEILFDGTVYKKIKNLQLKDYYTIKYDKIEERFILQSIVADKKSYRNKIASEYRNYIKDNENIISANNIISELSILYLQQLDNFEINGLGSIPSWKISNYDISEIPTIPIEIVKKVDEYKTSTFELSNSEHNN